jgi:hypothetical protein
MLEELLRSLATLTNTAQQHWEAEQAAEDEEPDDGQLWLTLEHPWSDSWACGWRVQLDEASEWAIHATGATPLEAAQRLLAKLTT